MLLHSCEATPTGDTSFLVHSLLHTCEATPDGETTHNFTTSILCYFTPVKPPQPGICFYFFYTLYFTPVKPPQMGKQLTILQLAFYVTSLLWSHPSRGSVLFLLPSILHTCEATPGGEATYNFTASIFLLLHSCEATPAGDLFYFFYTIYFTPVRPPQTGKLLTFSTVFCYFTSVKPPQLGIYFISITLFTSHLWSHPGGEITYLFYSKLLRYFTPVKPPQPGIYFSIKYTFV